MPIIAIAGFQHETNTFAPSLARYEDFIHGGGFPGLTRGQALLKFSNQNIPIGGFIHTAQQLGYQLHPILWAGASPSAHVEQHTYEKICNEILDGLRAQPVDAIYLDLHGAMVAEHLDDGEGELLQRIRALVGQDIPIVTSLDFHANVTQLMFKHSTAMLAYRTYPHIDMAETGARCAQVLHDILQGQKLYKHYYKLPFLIALNAQCTDLEPAKSTFAHLKALEQQSGVLLNFTPGFPAADFSECGATLWAYSADIGSLQQVMQQYQTQLLADEAKWHMDFLQPEAAIREAEYLFDIHKKPIIIADTQDNPGAGGDSNTTGMLHALVKAKAQRALVGLICDAKTVQATNQLQLGDHFYAQLGGTTHGDPALCGEFVLKARHVGQFNYQGPMMHGVAVDIGQSILVSYQGIDIAVSSYKAQLLDRVMFKIFNILPEDYRLIVVKSSVHFRADFTDMSGAILVAKAQGPMLADPRDLNWQNINPEIRLAPLSASLKSSA
ncbi:M81 family metallopeptidase [uncultured Acinetobacter sp.]|uniref:M81 family metallopeptidase n=1 Tax=uncultured Acinetobacter sp. TaxID=165433 RepID=UPI002631FE8B|nr:M81 family metallopeptidase [uncultured Acinetobacter sp.]